MLMQLHHSQLVGFGIALKAPAADGDAGHVLKTDGAGTLSFGAEADAVAMAYLDQSVKVAASPTFAGATLTGPLQVTRTTEQARIHYDASNYFSVTVGSTGTVTLSPAGSNPSVSISSRLTAANSSFTAAHGSFIGTGQNPGFVSRVQRPSGTFAVSLTEAFSENTTTGLSSKSCGFGVYGNLQSGITAPTTEYVFFAAGASAAYNSTHFRLHNVAGKTVSFDGDILVGGTSSTASARLHVIKTTEQIRVGYDASNYFSVTVGSTGTVTLDAVGAGAGFAFSDSCRFNGGTASSDGTAGATGSVATAKVGGGTRTLHFKNGLYTGYTDS